MTKTSPPSPPVRLFLCGDVMTGRGIDQILPHPCAPHLFEPCIRSARGYVELAEAAHGPIRRPVDPAYVWGDALAVLDRIAPHVRIVNLETAVTTAEDAWPDKGIHYRMHPANVGCLGAAGIDCCTLANNHVLDWGYAGLAETLATLRAAGMRTAGAGRDAGEAAAPAILDAAGAARVLVHAFGLESAGVPPAWAARADGPGVNFLADLSPRTADAVSQHVLASKRAGDVAVASIHWGGNWGYRVPRAHRDFARCLIDAGGVDVVCGHSSHHPQAIEVHRGKLILHGCGDFLNDYEGISGYDAYRPDLCLMYFPALDPATGRLVDCSLQPMRVRRFRVQRAPPDDAEWLRGRLDRECARLGTRVDAAGGDAFRLRW
jgi:poly-gamma-glutamate synthesis protein (capsule biosynthesis protein)